MKNILLADDHSLARLGLRTLFENSAGYNVVGDEITSNGAIAAARRLRPDIVIMDLSIAPSGMELIKSLKVELPNVLILVVSALDEMLYAERALRAGAHGYVMKQAPTREIMNGLAAIEQDQVYMSEKVKARVLTHLVGGRGEKRTSYAIDSLSDRELEVFKLIGSGISTRNIAQRLSLSSKTIDSYREHLKLKLNLATGPDLVQYAVNWNRDSQLVPA